MADRNEILYTESVKFCRRCETLLPFSYFYKSKREKDGHRTYCKSCVKADDAKRYRDNKSYREKSLKRSRQQTLARFGVSEEVYNEMLERQNGVCAICKGNGKKKLAVDHDHVTGKVRQLLCIHCNTALGHFKDDPELLQAAIEYLKRHSNGG